MGGDTELLPIYPSRKRYLAGHHRRARHAALGLVRQRRAGPGPQPPLCSTRRSPCVSLLTLHIPYILGGDSPRWPQDSPKWFKHIYTYTIHSCEHTAWRCVRTMHARRSGPWGRRNNVELSIVVQNAWYDHDDHVFAHGKTLGTNISKSKNAAGCRNEPRVCICLYHM